MATNKATVTAPKTTKTSSSKGDKPKGIDMGPKPMFQVGDSCYVLRKAAPRKPDGTPKYAGAEWSDGVSKATVSGVFKTALPDGRFRWTYEAHFPETGSDGVPFTATDINLGIAETDTHIFPATAEGKVAAKKQSKVIDDWNASLAARDAYEQDKIIALAYRTDLNVETLEQAPAPVLAGVYNVLGGNPITDFRKVGEDEKSHAIPKEDKIALITKRHNNVMAKIPNKAKKARTEALARLKAFRAAHPDVVAEEKAAKERAARLAQERAERFAKAREEQAAKSGKGAKASKKGAAPAPAKKEAAKVTRKVILPKKRAAA